MIAINRPPAPDFLTDRTQKWMQETERAIAHYAIAGQNEEFKFDHYNDKKVKAALKEVFVKCAYCESIYDSTSDGDIEHFRPKGKVREKDPQTPGYYWLANDWNNLFLSCQHCNQERQHHLHGVFKLLTMGKKDQFPLLNNDKRMKNPGDPFDDEEEVRWILNPCKDKPENHFEYDVTHALMLPLTPRAEKSIEIYVLGRSFLVGRRKERLAYLLNQIELVKQQLESLNENPTPEQKNRLDQQWDFMMRYTESTSEYAGMARYFVKKFLKENHLLTEIPITATV